ncbi:regulation of transcription [Spatholobus suberectus]|nr:regulation of transcription [Spatholobus suberectus]
MDMETHAMAGASDSNADHTPISSCVNDNNNKLYKGVRKRKWGKWVSEIRLPNSRERIWLGSYDSPEKAARAFDAALYCLRGRHANFNFPNTPCNMDVNVAVAGDQSLAPQEIQEVAAKFANEDPLLVKPLDHINQEQPQRGGGTSSSFGSKLTKSDSIAESSTTTYTPTTTASSCSTTMYECDGTAQVDHGDMDWNFLNVFDYSNEVVPVVSDYDHYYELDKVHSGELLYSTPPPPPFEGYEGLIEADDEDPFSHQSFLWNWNF